MAAYNIYIDGAVGTTGLQIAQRLAAQPDIQVLQLPEAQRKDVGRRQAMLHQADLSILCLPDDAAREIAAAAPADARLIDASTAHRTNPDWVYGFAELAGRRKHIAAATRVSVPGCHATGFLALAAPLVEAGALAPSAPLVCHSLTGYSGGGKQMIADYEAPNRPAGHSAPRLYGLTLQHKHLPEMQAVAELAAPPIFCPVVDDYYSGMLVTLPLAAGLLPPVWQSQQALVNFYKDYYKHETLITVHPAGEAPDDNMLSAGTFSGRDDLEIFVLGNESQFLLAARFDNLGKGAAGAAVQCMNLMLGRSEFTGLNIP